MDIPNLFNATEHAERLYSIMLAPLQLHDAFHEITDAARVIRGYGHATIGERAALFTHHFDRDALWYLGRHTENWSRHVDYETLIFGDLVDIESVELLDKDVYFVAEMRTPLHFACGRFSESVACMERLLGLALRRDFCDQVLYSVTNDDKFPTHPVRVTLRDIYEALGKSLTEWSDWELFVSLIPDALLAPALATHEDVKNDPSVLVVVDKAMFDENRRNAARHPLPECLHSPWDEELLKWFPFMEAFPSRRA